MAAGGHGDMPESVSTDTLSSLRNVDTEQVQNDDFNNLITVIAGYATLMREDLDGSNKTSGGYRSDQRSRIISTGVNQFSLDEALRQSQQLSKVRNGSSLAYVVRSGRS